ncbi:Protease 3 precursor [compost metagenome]
MNKLMTERTPNPTHEYTLENGLKIIVREDHRAPVVISQLWYKVGSSYEHPGQSGLSHALEHMVFKGSNKTRPGEASIILRNLGAKENAFTSNDATVYHQLLARDYLSVALELEADRMVNAHLPAGEFNKEIEVIKEERRLNTDDKPMSKAYERFNAMAYPASGYHTPTIGWMADLERMKLEELRLWYQSWYAPNNATLVVVGAVTLEEVVTLAQRWFGPIPRRDIPPVKIPLELAEPGERRITVHTPIQVPQIFMAFNVPGIATAEDKRLVNALRLIASLLDGGDSARIPALLQRGEELVSYASSGYAPYTRGDSLFTLSATPNVQKHKTIEQVEAGLWRLLEQLKTTAPSAEEMERVRAQAIAQLAYQRDLISRQAHTIGKLETIGLSWKLMDTELAGLQEVTPEDIRKAAHAFFTRARLSVAHVLPEEITHETGGPDGPNLPVESLAELDGKAPSSRKLDVQTWNTSEGARVLFVATPEMPMLDLQLTIAAGSSQDGGHPGLALMANCLLNEGIAEKNANQIAEVFEAVGAVFNASTHKDLATVSLRSLSAADKRGAALKLFAEVVGKPAFQLDSIARYKNQLAVALEDTQQSISQQVSLEAFKRLYGDHPYAHSKYGNAQNISLITPEQLRTFHTRTHTAANVVIALVGDISRAEAEMIAAQVSSALPKGPVTEKIEQPAEPESGIFHIETASTQTHLMLAQLGIDRNDPDYAALSMGNQILGGGGFGSRLMSEVREKRGLTYGVYSSFTPMQARGPFMIKLQTRAEMSEGTLKLVKDVLANYLETGPTEKELDDAKRKLVGSFPLSTASNADIVGQLGAIGFYNLPLSHLEDFMQQSQALTVEQVKAAMNKHLSTDKMVIISAGPTVPQKTLPAPADKPSEQPLGVPEH